MLFRDSKKSDSAVASLALLVFQDGLEKILPPEIGPECRGYPDFGIGDLPEKEIADAHFAAGADKQVWIRNAGGIQKTGHHFFADASPVTVVVQFIIKTVEGVH